jgi:hypothetical protein
LTDCGYPKIYPAPQLAAFRCKSNRKASSAVAQHGKIAGEPGAGQASMRGQFQTVAAGEMSAVTVAGLLIRYGFYAIGMLVFGMVGIGIMSMWKVVPKVVSDPPAFRIASGEFAAKPSSGHVQVSSHYGRIEVVQYGELNNRSTDLAVMTVLPPPDTFIGVRLVQDMTDINLLQIKGPRVMSNAHYDLETRFGDLRATEMRVETDGRWKQCLSFRSRFGVPAVLIAGWYCDGTGAKPSAGALACSLDKLVLDRELATKGADTFMRERMGKPAHCQAAPVTQTIDVERRGMSPPSRWSQPSATYRSPYRSY